MGKVVHTGGGSSGRSPDSSATNRRVLKGMKVQSHEFGRLSAFMMAYLDGPSDASVE